MFGLGKKRINIESYKGVRDFYPYDQAIQKYIFGVMREVVDSWGYEEYNTPLLEPLDLYKAKSSEEIVSEQIYKFEDRGGREVALRPEMTPSVARMVGAKIQEFPLPLRWYSIANFFRYEKPQRGRDREFWQLNTDIFGVKDFFADVEVVRIAFEIMRKFGAKPEDFIIKINSRILLEDIFEGIGIDNDKKQFVYRLIDKKDKMKDLDFRKSMSALIGESKSKELLETIYYGEGILSMMQKSAAAVNLNSTIQSLREFGVSNIVFDPTITRGFDYYTGMVFEVFDTNEANHRSVFGGGRYDNLVGLFAGQDVPAVGFGMGDITIRDFLETHNLLPKTSSSAMLYICVVPDTDLREVYKIADKFRMFGISNSVDISGKKLSDQLKSLDKRNIPYVITVGADEIKSLNFTLRNTSNREETSGNIETLAEKVANDLSSSE